MGRHAAGTPSALDRALASALSHWLCVYIKLLYVAQGLLISWKTMYFDFNGNEEAGEEAKALPGAA